MWVIGFTMVIAILTLISAIGLSVLADTTLTANSDTGKTSTMGRQPANQLTTCGKLFQAHWVRYSGWRVESHSLNMPFFASLVATS